MKKIRIKIIFLALLLCIPSIVNAQIESEQHPISETNFNQISLEDNEKNIISITLEDKNLVKMTGDNIIWQTNLDLGLSFCPRSIAVDSNDNIYVIGNYFFKDTSIPYSNFKKTEIIKVSKTGEILWHKPLLENANDTEATRIRIYNDEIYVVTKGFKDITYNRTEPTGYGNTNLYIYDINTIYTFIKLNTDGDVIKEEELYLKPDEYYISKASIWGTTHEIYHEIIIDDEFIYISLTPYLYKLTKDGSLVSSKKNDYAIISIEKDGSKIIGVGQKPKLIESLGYERATPLIVEMDTSFNVLKEINSETTGINVRIRKAEGGFFILSQDYDINENPITNLTYYDQGLNKVETVKLNNEYYITDANYASDNRLLVADNIGGNATYGYYYFKHEKEATSVVIKKSSLEELENTLKEMNLTEEELSRINTIKWIIEDSSIAIIEDNKIIGLKPGKTKIIGYIGSKKIKINVEIYDGIINPETKNNIIILLATIALVVGISIYTKKKKIKSINKQNYS